MNRDNLRIQYREAFYRSLAEGGVKMDLPPAQLQALSQAAADGLFAVLDAMEGEAPLPSSAAPVSSPDEERVLWKGKPYLSLGTRYELTSQRLRILRGLFSRSLDELDLVRVREAKVTQHLGERAFNLGDIAVHTTDPEIPELVLENVRDPMEVRELLRSAYLAEQKRRGLSFREES